MSFQITPRNFYMIGFLAFFIISLMNILSFFVNLSQYNAFAIISTLAHITFTSALTIFFLTLLRQTKVKVKNEYASDDVQEIINKIKNDNKKRVKTAS